MTSQSASSAESISALLDRAFTLHQQGKLVEARAHYSEALKAAPNNAHALHLLGVLNQQEGRHGEAEQLILRSLAIQPNHPDALNNLGNVQLALNRPRDAVSSYERAIMLNPRCTQAFMNRGNALHELQEFQDALKSYDAALALDDSSAITHNNRGDLLRDLNRPEDALASFNRAIELEPTFAAAYINRGNVHRSLRRFSNALGDFDHAIELNPTSAAAYNNRGNILRELGEHQLAIQSFTKALAINPDLVDTHLNLAFCHLAMGALVQGWRQYEWRWKLPHLKDQRVFKQPRWDGKDSLRGKTILIHCEQGFGDTIQFCRYLKLLNERGGRVLFEVQKPLLSLLRELQGIDDILPEGATLPHFDLQLPLLSLPGVLRTTLTTIPVRGRYIFSNPQSVSHWRAHFSESSLPRIGICWSGNPHQENDRNRSMTLDEFVQALPPGAHYVSLQKEIRSHDQKTLAARTDITHLGDRINDFSDTAAIIEHVDAVVSVDSSIAHLAGAMNKNLCLLLPFNADWRWLTRRQDSPWYHSAILYRQQRIGDWSSVLSDARGYIASMIHC
jgi:tetratricopeptide (TPR) repeat protein